MIKAINFLYKEVKLYYDLRKYIDNEAGGENLASLTALMESVISVIPFKVSPKFTSPIPDFENNRYEFQEATKMAEATHREYRLLASILFFPLTFYLINNTCN